MADDPRLLEAADFLKADVGRVATAAEIETATDMLRELDALDPLRALLADEDQAVEVMSAAAWNALCETVWADESAQHRAQWVRENRFEYAAMLAALREVAGP